MTAEQRAVDVGARDVARAALDWLHGNRDRFRLPDDVLAPDTSVDRTLKPLGELAQMCTSMRQHTGPDDPHHLRAAELVEFAWRETGEGALFLDLFRSEPAATYPLEIYAAFAGGGLRHAPAEDVARTVARTRSWALTEQQPNRRLGVLNSERRIGLPPHDSPREALRRTWLGGLPEPWTFECASGYTLTHVVFHLTDWGNAPHAVPPDIEDYLATWLPSWLDTCVEDEQWDLTSELLAVSASLPDPRRAAADDAVRAAWAALAAAQDGSGALPEVGPGSRCSQGRDVERNFLNCYHSTLMAAFAAVLTLAHDHGGHDRGEAAADAVRVGNGGHT
ncbi:DUF6895 family protein [Streptomyces daliensis]